jgi:hypothetical protein
MIIASGSDELAFGADGVNVATRFSVDHCLEDLLPDVPHVYVPVQVLVRVHSKEEPVIMMICA